MNPWKSFLAIKTINPRIFCRLSDDRSLKKKLENYLAHTLSTCSELNIVE